MGINNYILIRLGKGRVCKILKDKIQSIELISEANSLLLGIKIKYQITELNSGFVTDTEFNIYSSQTEKYFSRLMRLLMTEGKCVMILTSGNLTQPRISDMVELDERFRVMLRALVPS